MGLGLVVLLCIWPARARAWILHEHETVVRDALASLAGTPAANVVERAWQHAIHGQRLALCGSSGGSRFVDYWRLRAPLLARTPVHEYSGELGTRQRLLFGGDVSRTDHGMAHGVYLAWVQDARLYYWRPD